MSRESDRLRAMLSRRLRSGGPKEWGEFTQLWMAFNAQYGGEPDHRERARVMAVVRRTHDERSSRALLRSCKTHIERIVDIPPGDMRLESWDPAFRAASKRCVGLYLSKSESSVSRLAGVAGVLYQIRCNLMHGSKDPRVPRDRMLVQESVQILRPLVESVEGALAA